MLNFKQLPGQKTRFTISNGLEILAGPAIQLHFHIYHRAAFNSRPHLNAGFKSLLSAWHDGCFNTKSVDEKRHSPLIGFP